METDFRFPWRILRTYSIGSLRRARPLSVTFRSAAPRRSSSSPPDSARDGPLHVGAVEAECGRYATFWLDAFKVGRTIADLTGDEQIALDEVAQALFEAS